MLRAIESVVDTSGLAGWRKGCEVLNVSDLFFELFKVRVGFCRLLSDVVIVLKGVHLAQDRGVFQGRRGGGQKFAVPWEIVDACVKLRFSGDSDAPCANACACIPTHLAPGLEFYKVTEFKDRMRDR